MKSSTGAHFIALDHIRALAAYQVVAWHFIHGQSGYPVPFEFTPVIFPLALLDEGHTGVALFMTLSGYLFAKLLNGRSVDYPSFLWNRALRLLPLLSLVMAITTFQHYWRGGSLWTYIRFLAMGVLLPTLPNGGWSITVEFHYYMILPVFLWLLRRSKLLPLAIIAGMLVIRLAVWWQTGAVQSISYQTIIGRMDQFAWGMMVFQFPHWMQDRGWLAAIVASLFAGFYWIFAVAGGFYHLVSYPSAHPLWIVMPAIEGLSYALLISWYDNSFAPAMDGISKWIGKAGEFSYSIYLLHFFFVFDAARLVHQSVMDLSNFYIACLWALMFFAAMVPLGYLSFQFVEGPFLALRRHYLRSI